MKEEEKKRTSLKLTIKRFLKKRWAMPAIYIASAAIILSAFLWYQNSTKDPEPFDYEATDLSGKKHNEPAVEVNRVMENFIMPVKDSSSAVIKKPFYDVNGEEKDQVAALVFYNNTYHPNTGIDVAMENGETFEVVAALSGTVKDVKEDTILGNVIEIEHDKGIVTQYQSITDMNVEIGDEVKQGQTIAKAGKSLLNEEAGIHVHFEIRKDGVPVNPQEYLNKPLSSLQEANVEKNVKDTEEKENSKKDNKTNQDKNNEN